MTVVTPKSCFIAGNNFKLVDTYIANRIIFGLACLARIIKKPKLTAFYEFALTMQTWITFTRKRYSTTAKRDKGSFRLVICFVSAALNFSRHFVSVINN